MRSRTVLMSSAVLGALLIFPPTAWGGGSVGSSSIYSSVDSNRPGRAKAFRNVASASGPVNRLSVYLAPSSTASRVEVGLYRDRSGRPSSLLLRCAVSRPRASSWNSCSTRRRKVKAGGAYWTTLLQPKSAKGRLRFFSKRSGVGKAMRSSRTTLTRLPRSWARGQVSRRGGPASVLAHTAGSPPLSPFPDSPSKPKATPAPTSTLGTGCFADPSACGYPDLDNTGPSGSLQPAASASLPPGAAWDAGTRTLRITGNNVVVQNLDVPGPIAVDGDNATIRNSRIHVHSGCSNPCGSYGIRLGRSGDEVTGTVLQDLDIITVDASPANDNPLDPATIDVKVDHGVRNNGDRQVTADRLYVKGFAGAWKGPGTIRDSYLFSQLVFAGDHVEAYLNGGEGNPSILQHNTILNPVAQTAAISFFNDFGGIGQVTVRDNLLAGGGYVMYGGAKNGTGNVTGPVLVQDNRIARGNRDSRGYFPNGGAYGLWAEFNRAATTSCGNIWDDNRAPTPAPSSAGSC